MLVETRELFVDALQASNKMRHPLPEPRASEARRGERGQLQVLHKKKHDHVEHEPG